MIHRIRKLIPKALLCLTLTACMMLCISAQATVVTPRYTGISELTVALDITSSGRADCYAYMEVNSGYTAELKMELQQDGDTIKSWTTSGSGTLELDKSYYVAEGYDYQVIASAKVKNSSGTIVDRPYLPSDFVYYS